MAEPCGMRSRGGAASTGCGVRMDQATQRAQHSLASAGSLHLSEELLLHRVEQVGAEVARVQQDLVLQGDLQGK